MEPQRGEVTGATVLLEPDGINGLRAITCERIAVAPGRHWESSALAEEEQLCYVTTGWGVLTALGGWAYQLEQRSAFWLGSGVSFALGNSGEATLIVVRFRFRKKGDGSMVGPPRRIVQASASPTEQEVSRTVRILFRGPEIGSATLVGGEESTFPGGGASPAHRAPGMEEVFYFVRGRGRVRIGDRVLAVRPGEAVAIPDGVLHSVEADPGEVLRHVTCNILV